MIIFFLGWNNILFFTSNKYHDEDWNLHARLYLSLFSTTKIVSLYSLNIFTSRDLNPSHGKFSAVIFVIELFCFDKSYTYINVFFKFLLSENKSMFYLLIEPITPPLSYYQPSKILIGFGELGTIVINTSRRVTRCH